MIIELPPREPFQVEHATHIDNEQPTNFDLSDNQVDLLIAAARQLIRESPDFQAFLERNRRRGGR